MQGTSKHQTSSTLGDQEPVALRMFESVADSDVEGEYDMTTQTWSHRQSGLFSPVKLNQEM